MNIQKINEKSYAYSKKLRDLHSRPKHLYLLGNSSLLESNEKGKEPPRVAIVGTRNPSFYGEQVTRQLASELSAAGATIVSGLALGIDAIAHQAVVDQGLPNIAVQARGLDDIYPDQNRELAKQILAHNGLILSEYPSGTQAFKQNFVARNRIVAALSDIVIITEATLDSGTKHTIRFANEMGRTIMAVPGNITSNRSAMANNQIKLGAKPITSTADVVEELNQKVGLHLKPIKAESREEQILIDLMKEGVNQSEELIARGNITASEFANLISLMEISGKVTNMGAGVWVLS